MTAYDVLIIGAGFSGVVAARTLAKRNYRVLILEARDRVGGRAHTLPVSSSLGFPVELGCMAIHGYNWGNPARLLSQELSIATSPAPPGKPAVYIANKGPIESTLANKLGSTFGDAYSTLRSPDVKGSAASVLENRSKFESDEEKALFVALSRAAEFGPGVPLEKLAAKWLTYAEGVSYTSGPDGFVAGGYGALIRALLDDAGSQVEIKLNTEVVGLTKGPDSISAQTKDGQTFSASASLSTIPVGVLKSVLKSSPSFFNPSLPTSTFDAINRISVGNLEKVALIYDHPWWPSEPPAFHILQAERQVSLLAIPIGPRTGNSKSGLLVLIHFSLIGDAFQTPTTLHDTIAATLAPGRNSIPRPIEAHSSNWASDPFSLGAATSPPLINNTSEEQQTPLDFLTLSRPPANWEGRLGFAGEGVEAFHRGSVPGAIISGQREGERIAAFLSAQTSGQ